MTVRPGSAALGCLLALCVCGPAAAQEEGEPFRPRSLAYVLQAEALGSRSEAVAALKTCGRDLLILDTSYSGAVEDDWTVAELGAIRGGKDGRRVLAYLSIGEAEDYRAYWKRAWDLDQDGTPDQGSPEFLEPENPEWSGNYTVRYWKPAWQAHILARVTRIVAQGFDGVYLDIVDGFEHFEAQSGQEMNPETKRSYRADMVAWVGRVAERGRKISARPFLIVPQNGSQLLTEPGYMELISAVAVEDLFADGDRRQDPAHTREVLSLLKRAKKAAKPIFVVEYPTAPSVRVWVEQQARTHGFVLLMTDRELKTLGRASAEPGKR